ncbi:uncharacterized protein VTP21DRAFT_11054 [Calcarisporiella thermophila]|uniref:uncharacterized protein n=1 Tax=Calcarisporiella thermophila TaxID=911321 RepID=UPI003744A0BE
MSGNNNRTAYPEHIPGQTQLQQPQPGIESQMHPRPIYSSLEGTREEQGTHIPTLEEYRGAGKLAGKIALVTGGDSGIGRAAAVLFAKEKAEGVVITYLPQEHQDAVETMNAIEKEGVKGLAVSVDLAKGEEVAKGVVDQVIKTFGRIDVLVNNAAEQHMVEKIEDVKAEEIESTFRTNIFSMFYLTKHALPHMKRGSSIINTTSVVAFQGHPKLLAYSATKGAIVSFTRSLAMQLADRGIRVNGVAPGPVYTPLQPASREKENMEGWGKEMPLSRPGQPAEIGPSYVFLASQDSSQYIGQILHPNGGTPI